MSEVSLHVILFVLLHSLPFIRLLRRLASARPKCVVLCASSETQGQLVGAGESLPPPLTAPGSPRMSSVMWFIFFCQQTMWITLTLALLPPLGKMSFTLCPLFLSWILLSLSLTCQLLQGEPYSTTMAQIIKLTNHRSIEAKGNLSRS